MAIFSHQTENEQVEEIECKDEEIRHLILFNDDINTFDYVIETLIKICKHDRIQAEQCAYIVHYNGKCSIKIGNFKKLKPMQNALLEHGLSAEIK